MSIANKNIVERWFKEVWTEGRADSIDVLMAPRCLVHGLDKGTIGPAGFKEFHAAYRKAFPDVRLTLDHVVAEGDMVAACWSGTGTHKGDGLGVSATGKPVRFRGMTFARIQDGKLVEGWNVFDQLGMFRQLGMVNF